MVKANGIMAFNVALNQNIAKRINYLDKDDCLKMKKFFKYNLKFNQIRKVSLSSHLTPMLLIFLALIANNNVIGSQRDITNIKSTLKKSTNAIQNSNSALLDQDDLMLKKLPTGNKVSPLNMISNASIYDEHEVKTSNAATKGVMHASNISLNVNSSSAATNSFQSKIIKNKLNVAMATNISKLNRNSVESSDEGRSGPYFDKSASKNVTALLGKTAYLNCRVKNLGNKTMLLQVSWVRHRDIHLLTVGRYTYTSDQRFRAIHQPQTEDWLLQIKYPQHRDSGIYECQVSTTPHMSHYIHLNVVEPSTEIVGAPDLYIESGSTINLTCIVLNSPEPPAYIFWNHNDNIINYDSPRGGVSVLTIKGETTTSFLLIKSAKPSDSGLYQCNPSNAKPKQVTVHVLNGEIPAPMQRAGQAHHHLSQNHYLFLYMLIYLFTSLYVKHILRPA